jgi:hypothetical protein
MNSRILKERIVYINPIKIAQLSGFYKMIKNQYKTFDFSLLNKKIYDIRECGICGGDWDLEVFPFKEHSIYKSFVEIMKGSKKEDTEEYKKLLFSKGKEKTDVVFKKWLELYASIKKKGYVLNTSVDPWDEYITICIGRDGQLFFHNGGHRLAVCLFLGISSIPVKIAIRHTQWVYFIEKIKAYSKKHNNKIYTPINHIDLQSFETTYSSYRGELIKEYINPKSKTVLDIGTHWGYLSFILADIGKECYAIEHDPETYYFLNRINKISSNKIKTYCTDVDTFIFRKKQVFDCVLALNVFHHFLKTKETWERFCKMIKVLQFNEMFLQFANDEELLNHPKYTIRKTTKEILELVGKNKKINIIGKEHNRVIYHIVDETVERK